jgi:uncharacterized protein (DUF58 family)
MASPSTLRPPGLAALVTAAAALPAGFVLGWAEPVALGLALAGVTAVAALFALGRSTYTVHLDLSRRRVPAGADAFGGLTVANAGRRGLLPTLVTLPVGPATAAFPVPRLAAGETHEETFRIPTARRAVIPLGPVTSSRGDPLGLVRRQLTWTEPEELYVHPATVPVPDVTAGFVKDVGGRPAGDLASSDVAFHTLRDYVSGDDLRHVHWRSSVHVGRLLVRQFEQTRHAHLVVVLSLDPADYTSDDAFELACSAAASLGLQALRDGIDLTARTAAGPLAGHAPAAFLDDCARLDFGPPAAPLDRVALAAAQTAPRASAAVLVTGVAAPAARLRSAQARFPAHVQRIVLRCAPGIPASRHDLGGATVLDLGDLAGLARVLTPARRT